MDARTLVSRLKHPVGIQDDDTNAWQSIANDFPYFAHAQYLRYAQKKLQGEPNDVRVLSPFKQNPIKFLEFFNVLEHPEMARATADSLDETPSAVMDELPMENRDSTTEDEKLIDDWAEHTMDSSSVEDLSTEQSNAVDDAFDLEASLNEKEELREQLAEAETAVINHPTNEPEPLMEEHIPMTTNTISTEENLVSQEDKQESEYLTEDPAHDAVRRIPDHFSSIEDKSLMVMMSFMDWLHHFQHKTQAEQEEEREKKALKTAWQKEKLSAIVEEEEEEIPENIFKQAMESISLESTLISESLARLLAKQGKTDKAIDMYKKLSLRNPEKSAYFADLIKEIHLNNI